MGDKSAIEWTEATWNPIAGCSRVSEGCRHCYAEREAHRLGTALGQSKYDGLTVKRANGEISWTGEVRLWEQHLDQPLRWKRPRRIFVNSMSDLFHESVPDEWIDRVFAVMALAQQHTFQVLTKRPERMREYLNGTDFTTRRCLLAQMLCELNGHDPRDENAEDPYWWWPLTNVWLGVSVEDQKTADERIPLLLQTPAAVRWVSAEPLLGPVDLRPFKLLHRRWGVMPEGLHWVVVGSESGSGARPMHPDWARSLRDQCREAGVPFFMKQGSKDWPNYKDVNSFPRDLQIREYPKNEFVDSWDH